MRADYSKPHFYHEQPIGQSIVVIVPLGMPCEYAEESARSLLKIQPPDRFPPNQYFAFEDDRQLMIRGLGHNSHEIQKFSNELQATWFAAWTNGHHLRPRQPPVERKGLILLSIGALIAIGATIAWTNFRLWMPW